MIFFFVFFLGLRVDDTRFDIMASTGDEVDLGFGKHFFDYKNHCSVVQREFSWAMISVENINFILQKYTNFERLGFRRFVPPFICTSGDLYLRLYRRFKQKKINSTSNFNSGLVLINVWTTRSVCPLLINLSISDDY